MISKQSCFPGFNWKKSSAFVGQTKGNPRSARPITTKRYMHLVLKSRYLSTRKAELNTPGAPVLSFFVQGRTMEKLCRRVGNLCLVEVRDVAFAHDHMHLIIKPKSVYAYRRFIKALSGLIARFYLKKERGRAQGAVTRSAPAKPSERFWQARPFTRFIEWGKDLVGITHYLLKNRLDHLKIPRDVSHEMIQRIFKRMALNKKTQLEAVGFG